MKRFLLLLFFAVLMGACAEKSVLSAQTQKWLKDYEAVVDQYLDEIQKNPVRKPSREIKKKLLELQKSAVKIKTNLKTKEGIPFIREFSRITMKLARNKTLQKLKHSK